MKDEGRRTQDKGRRTKDEGRKAKEEGRRTKDEGRRTNDEQRTTNNDRRNDERQTTDDDDGGDDDSREPFVLSSHRQLLSLSLLLVASGRISLVQLQYQSCGPIFVCVFDFCFYVNDKYVCNQARTYEKTHACERHVLKTPLCKTT